MHHVDRTEFIAAMRNVASSVSVVTTDGIAGKHGATVSAFCSVSADPPTVLVCLNATSRIAQLVRQNRVFALNVLPDGATQIAERFAGKDDNQLACRFDGIETTGDLPNLVGATTLNCALSQAVIEGTHLVCMGTVQKVTLGPSAPLTYMDGRYHTLAAKGAA